MKLRIFLAIVLTLTFVAQTPGLQTQEDVIRIETNLVTVPVTVKTRAGAYVPNLEVKDFQIYEDGVLQEIAQFETVDKPFTVTLMLDVASAAAHYALIYPIQYNSLRELAGKRFSDPGFPEVSYTTPSGESLSKAYERGTQYLRKLGQTSGGRFHYADNVKYLRRAFALIAQELRQQYSLSYYPKNQTATKNKRRIKVEVSVPDAVVHARESYMRTKVRMHAPIRPLPPTRIPPNRRDGSFRDRAST